MGVIPHDLMESCDKVMDKGVLMCFFPRKKEVPPMYKHRIVDVLFMIDYKNKRMVGFTIYGEFN